MLSDECHQALLAAFFCICTAAPRYRSGKRKMRTAEFRDKYRNIIYNGCGMFCRTGTETLKVQ
jgi:hypothetical protein